MATGLGKTFTAVKLADNFERTLLIVPSEELAEQGAMAFLREKFDERLTDHIQSVGFINYIRKGGVFANTDYKVGLIKADVFQPYGNLVVTSAQTLHKRLDKLDPNYFNLVIADECHFFMSPSFLKGTSFWNPQLLIGQSATPSRLDNLDLTELFGEIAYEYNIKEGIQDGYLVELDGIRIKTNTNLDNVKTKGGDLNESQLANEVNTPARNFLIANKYLEHCKDRPAIGFAVDIRHAIDLAEAFNQKGIKADAVSSNEELTGDRKQKIKDFKEGRIKVLFNVNLLTTGVDIPEISCCIMARPTKSRTLFMQAIGRSTRTLTGVIDGLETVAERLSAIKNSAKTKSIILDVVDNTSKHDLVNTWTLDKALDPQDRIFITAEKREKLLAERQKRTIEGNRDKDEFVKLISLPKPVKASNSVKMNEEITEAQKVWLERLNYNTSETYYTKKMAFDIISQQQAARYKIKVLKECGYNVEGEYISNGIFEACIRSNKKVAELAEKLKPVIK